MTPSPAAGLLRPAPGPPPPGASAGTPTREGFTFWGLFFCLMVQYLQIGKQIPALETARPFLLSILVVGVAWLFDWMNNPRRPVVKDIQIWLFVTFISVTALSAPGAYNFGRAYGALELMLKYFAVYLLILSIVDSVAKFRKVIHGFIAVHAYMAARGVLSALRNPGDREAVGAAFFLGDSNDFAMVLTMLLPFTYFLLTAHRTLLAKAILVASGAMFVLATIFTHSRGGSIALSAVLTYCVLSSRRKAMAMTLTAVLLLLVAVAAPASYWDRIRTIWEPNPEETSAQIRLEAWRAGIQMALDHPLFGVGAANFGYVKGMIYRKEGTPGENWNWVGPHSIYFGTLAEQGFLGLILLLAMIGNAFLASRRAQTLLPQDWDPFLAATCNALAGSLLAFAVAGIFVGNTYHPVPWNTMAFTVVAKNLARRSAARPEYAANPSR